MPHDPPSSAAPGRLQPLIEPRSIGIVGVSAADPASWGHRVVRVLLDGGAVPGRAHRAAHRRPAGHRPGRRLRAGPRGARCGARGARRRHPCGDRLRL
ncbi:hypothetical protein ABXN37_27680 [Piscinibacter sakaiensis]|uniref:hypothetical protein n=1 Tax=Piscinibacter sakaiensis TaxID=1547922 RepID=UPI00372C5E1F